MAEEESDMTKTSERSYQRFATPESCGQAERMVEQEIPTYETREVLHQQRTVTIVGPRAVIKKDQRLGQREHEEEQQSEQYVDWLILYKMNLVESLLG